MICCFARPSMELQVTHSVLSSNTLVGRAMHCYAFRRLCLQGLSVKVLNCLAKVQYTSRRSCSRSSCRSASSCLYPTRTRKTSNAVAACGCYTIPAGCQREYLERGNALCRLVAARLANCGNWCIVAPVRQFSILGAAVRAPGARTQGLVRVVYISKP